MRNIACLFVLAFVALLSVFAQPGAVAQLPQHFIDGTSGEVILMDNPEFEPRYRFRCLRVVNDQSCTALAPRTMDNKRAYPIIRALIDRVVKESGVGNYTISLFASNSPGFAGGWIFSIRTDRGEKQLNAMWPALWLMLPGENDTSVRRRIAEALGGSGGIL